MLPRHRFLIFVSQLSLPHPSFALLLFLKGELLYFFLLLFSPGITAEGRKAIFALPKGLQCYFFFTV